MIWQSAFKNLIENPRILKTPHREYMTFIHPVNGSTHNVDEPAFIAKSPTGNILRYAYLYNGHFHRDPRLGPAQVRFHDNGLISDELFSFFVDGLESVVTIPGQDTNLHREDGPAYIEYYYDGTLFCEFYYYNNQLHRLEGPAKIYYNPDGSIASISYYEFGKHIETIRY